MQEVISKVNLAFNRKVFCQQFDKSKFLNDGDYYLFVLEN